jgi:hypothetical protein
VIQVDIYQMDSNILVFCLPKSSKEVKNRAYYDILQLVSNVNIDMGRGGPGGGVCSWGECRVGSVGQIFLKISLKRGF